MGYGNADLPTTASADPTRDDSDWGSVSSKRSVAAAAAAATFVLAVTGLLAASQAGAQPGQFTSVAYLLKATLNGRSEVPSPKDATGAKGTFTAKLTVAGRKSTFVWKLKFSGLSGRAVASHVHYGVAGKAGQIALPLCVPCVSSPSHGEYKGPYVATATFVKAVLHGGAYVDVHTKKNPNGEIRGQVKATAAG
jgi:hypothetical protein